MEKDDDSSACTASFSPSFSTYSGDRLAEIADRVGQRFSPEYDDDFEFEILQTASSSGVFPVFDQNLISAVEPEGVVTPLKDLFLRERKDPAPKQAYSSSSDDEDDELDAIPSEIYCPWTPARSTAEMSPSGGCRKSKSTGSSSTSSWSRKGWRFRDLLKRSRSDGKQFQNSSSECSKKKEKVVSAHEKFYLRNKAMREEDKKKSYLPYKQQLVGLFANMKSFPPF